MGWCQLPRNTSKRVLSLLCAPLMHASWGHPVGKVPGKGDDVVIAIWIVVRVGRSAGVGRWTGKMVGVVVLGETGTFGREDKPSHPPGDVGLAPDALPHVEEAVVSARRHRVPDGREGVEGSDPSSRPEGGVLGGEKESPERADEREGGDKDGPGVSQYPKRVAPHPKRRVEERSRVVLPIHAERLVLERQGRESLARRSQLGRLSERMVVVDNPMVDVPCVEPRMEKG